MTRCIQVYIFIQFIVGTIAGFSIGSSFAGSPTGIAVWNDGALKMEYVPSGMSKEQYKKLKAKERKRTAGKDLGKVGITTFKSRTFNDWQLSGGKNLFPVDPKSVKNAKEIPYMQRPGGAPDDSDLGGKKSNPLFGLFAMGKKTKEQIEAVEEKKTNWWTLK